MVTTHYAKINCSGRFVAVKRLGRIFMIPGYTSSFDKARGFQSVSICRYDARFTLMPRNWTPDDQPPRTLA